MSDIDSMDDIRRLAESSDLECKRATGRDGKGELPRSLWPTYSALANTDGGRILLGIEEKQGQFELIGIVQPDKIRADLFNTVNDRNKVSINLLANDDVKVKALNGKRFIEITVRRASRAERPVYLDNNPLGNTYIRHHEGDYRVPDDEVKRMLAEQLDESRDSLILTGFGMDDLSKETIKAYRQVFTALNPGHPFNAHENQGFLRQIGAWRTDRETGKDGLVASGLLMFGFHNVIQQAFPNYMLDYQERAEGEMAPRWLDRVMPDGTWSGNLYDFYRKVYPKLVDQVKVPFETKNGQRVDDSPVHIALREALCNALVHADYSDRASVLVIKRPDLFEFRNPGVMRIPVADAFRGGHADCRNRLLHQMFRYVGIGEQSGSGVPKILDGWKKNHWREPELADSRDPYNHTVLRMRMLDLFPQHLASKLREQFGSAYDNLPHEEQEILVVAAGEQTVTHQRLVTLTRAHTADVSRHLRSLVDGGFLTQTGSTRGAVYHTADTEIPEPNDVFGSPNADVNSSTYDQQGRLESASYELPFVEELDRLDPGHLEKLKALAAAPRNSRRIPRETMKQTLLNLLKGQYITLGCLADLVDRSPHALRSQYLTDMVKSGELSIAFPTSPNDPRQAYTNPAR